MRVYVAGPMKLGDHMANIRQGLDAGAALMKAGHSPFIPQLSSFFALVHPNIDYEDWLSYDFHWIEVCDALIRTPGESAGADREVKFAVANKIPVFLSVPAFLQWAGIS